MERLKELRETKRLNQDGLAMALNLSQSTISLYEKGERSPDIETLIQIAKFFNVSVDYLIGYSEIKRPIANSELTAYEQNLIGDFDKLSKREKEQVGAFIQGLLAAGK